VPRHRSPAAGPLPARQRRRRPHAPPPRPTVARRHRRHPRPPPPPRPHHRLRRHRPRPGGLRPHPAPLPRATPAYETTHLARPHETPPYEPTASRTDLLRRGPPHGSSHRRGTAPYGPAGDGPDRPRL